MSGPYDAGLPVLAELEADVRHAAEAALGRPGRGRRAPGSRPPARVVRRALVLVALALLVGATALAATGSLDAGGGDRAVRGAARDVAHGVAGGEPYRLVLHRAGRALCRDLVAPTELAGRCGRAPRAGEVEASSLLAGRARLVFGVAGPRARAVGVRVGDRRRLLTTARLGRDTTEALGLPPGLRVFVTAFPATGGSLSQPPAFVDGSPDCSLTTAPVAACRLP